MVINVLALFQFQNLQILKLTVKQDQSRQRKTPTSETQQRTGKGRTHTAYFFTLANLLLFCKIRASVPTSLTLLKILGMRKCLPALPAWDTAAGAPLSSLAQSHHQQSQTQIYVLCPPLLVCSEVTIYGTTDQCCRSFCRRLVHDPSQTLQKQLCFSKLFNQYIFEMVV